MAETFVDPFFVDADEDEVPVPDAVLDDDEGEVRLGRASDGRRNRRVTKVQWVPGDDSRDLEPVMVLIARTCQFKAKPCGLCDKPKSNAVHRKKTGTCPWKRQNGCASCGKPKNAEAHFGAPPSLNVLGSGNPQVFQGLKASWEKLIYAGLEKARLPRGLGSVLVEAEVSFGDAIERDHDNFRVVIAKACGDALVDGGWIKSDKWSAYELGRMALEEDGGNWTRLVFLPKWPDPEPGPLRLPI
jgi:hypothetical protein